MTSVISEPCVDVCDRARVSPGYPRSGEAGSLSLMPALPGRGTAGAYVEDIVKVIVYGDFNCPYSYLASQRADQLARGGIARIDWRAVEHDRGLALTGTPAEADRGAWDTELAEVAALALPGESVPAAPPPVISNTEAAVAAYAEAVSDGIAGELRAACSPRSGPRDAISAAPARCAAWSPG